MVVSVLLKMRFGHAQISVPKIGIPMLKLGCINPWPQTSDGILMHYKKYIEEMEVVEIDKPSQKDHKLLPHETQQLQRVAGQLNWVST